MEIEHLGFFGILKLTTHTILRNLKHFLCIALLLALPNALLFAFFPSSSSGAAGQALAHEISLLWDSAFHGHVPHKDDPLPPPAFPLAFLIPTFLVFIFLLTQPILTFSVSRACLQKSLSIKGSLSAIPRSVRDLILTVLSNAGIFLGLCTAMAVPMVAVAAGLSALGVDPTIFMVIWGLVMMGGVMYLAVAWSLAGTVAVMEEKSGWGAMERSRYLVDGSKWVAFELSLLFGGLMMFLPISVSDGGWRWSGALLSLSLQAMIMLWSMASTVVLYLSCKARWNESLETLIALSPQFGPLETSPKYLDLESASSHVSS